jgi:uncharacterized protein (TIGR03067 family)
MARRGALVAAVVALTLNAAARGGDDAKEELKKLQGDWPVIAEEFMGHDAPNASERGKITFEGEILTFKMAGRNAIYSLKLDPSASPKTADFTHLVGPLQGQVLPAIYKLNDDELWICFGKLGKPRPDGFDTKGSKDRTLLKCKRPKPPDEATAKEMKKLSGTWRVIAMEVAGQAQPEATFNKMKYIVSRDMISWIIAGKPGDLYYSYELNVKEDPKTIDMLSMRNNEKVGMKLKGIYKLDRDELTICLDAETAGRPAAFDTKPNTMRVLYRFKREKP